MYGNFGKILRVNLTDAKIREEELPQNLYERYIGGKGLAAYILYNEVQKGVEPLGSENKLIFTVGPVTGTNMPCASRYNVVFKSPLTNAYGESTSGGHFPAELKFAGLDGIVIEGASKNPVYLWINNEHAELRNAKNIWGKDTYETDKIVKEEVGEDKCKVACIGPAGENLVHFACIINDIGRSAGRCGAGAVMGSKKLKAIAVKGDKDVNVLNPAKLNELNLRTIEKINAHPWAGKIARKYGTPSILDSTNQQGVFPTRYWHEGTFEKADQINAEAMVAKIVNKSTACFKCPIACGKWSVVKQGPYAGSEVEGPEYETIYAFGGLCCIDSIEAIAKVNEVCDRYGLDTITSGNIIAFAMDLREKGILPSEKLGIDLRFGDIEGTLKLLKMISYRVGIGNTLALGVRAAAKKIGKEAEEIAIHVKGLEPAGYDPRGLLGMALSYAVASRGADHLKSCVYSPELGGKVDRFSYDKASLVKDLEDRYAVSDCMVFCRFTRDIYMWQDLTEVYSAVTGFHVDEKTLKMAGERINTLTRLFNVREGLRREDDQLPKRFFKEPLSKGMSKDKAINTEQFENMLSDYYSLRGWDKEGIPRREKILELSL
jgi:aldehyde:ferredoxin oxidoreductase